MRKRLHQNFRVISAGCPHPVWPRRFPAPAGSCKKRGPAFLFVLSFIGTALEVIRFVPMSERATTQIFGWALSSVLLAMLILNAIAG
jgi:hypothetical protein